MAQIYRVDLEAMVAPVLGPARADCLEKAESIVNMYFGKNPDSELTRDQALACDIVKQLWRENRPAIVRFWYDLETAAFQAVKTGTPYQCGRVVFGTRGRFLHMRLPSGRLLSYCDPEIRGVETPWGEEKAVVSCMTVNSLTNQWVRRGMYGGLWAENATQATARDVLAEAMLRVEKAGYGIVLSVHDEIGVEVPEGTDLDIFADLMAESPQWAGGLPIGVNAWQGRRYRKE